VFEVPVHDERHRHPGVEIVHDDGATRPTPERDASAGGPVATPQCTP
jgi:hypothetical protein